MLGQIFLKVSNQFADSHFDSTVSSNTRVFLTKDSVSISPSRNVFSSTSNATPSSGTSSSPQVRLRKYFAEFTNCSLPLKNSSTSSFASISSDAYLRSRSNIGCRPTLEQAVSSKERDINRSS